ncbi:60S ribosomal export protein NMD3 [Aplysia californica]|uniref:60S ribosomal export protein NMD3 n=1 Tax=Aplysia californica TaxID=6500 RepID=A0ABM0K5A6_APLCA|nr:60S ribosomal export protein NMD3 [Aplysia californica]
MEYLGSEGGPRQHYSLISCCRCGLQIEPNPTNMCVNCLRSDVDITEDIPKTSVLNFCRSCERYLQPPNQWVKAALESRELLSVCLKRLKGLNKVKLIDAGFVWTEPHSMRIKVKLTVQKEVMNGAVLQQVFVVEYTVQSNMCEDCHRVEAKDFWRAVVQVRQKCDHKKTFFYLEQLILKHRAHRSTVNIKPMADGLDFFFTKQDDAKKLVEFLSAYVPCRFVTGRELVSHDIRSNKYNYKHTFSVEIIPVCKDHIICLPKKTAQQLGGISPLCLVTRVTQSIHIIDPNTLQWAELSGAQYWRNPFKALVSPKQLIEYMVLEVNMVSDRDRPNRPRLSTKHMLADVYVARMSDLGANDQQFHCRSHLGHLLRAGDTVLGFDFSNANLNHQHFEAMKGDRIPDVMLVKKVFDRNKRIRRRKWKLERFDGADEADTESVNRDFNDFLEDLEEDQAIRENVNIYKDPSKISVQAEDTDDEGAPQISLMEMLEDLHISEDATGGEGAPMME